MWLKTTGDILFPLILWAKLSEGLAGWFFCSKQHTWSHSAAFSWCLVPGLEDPGSFIVCVWPLIASPKPCCTAGLDVVSMAVSGWLDFLPRRQAPRHKCLSSLLLTTSKQCGQAQIQRERAYTRAWIQGDSLVPWWPPLQPFTMSLFCLCPWFSLPLTPLHVSKLFTWKIINSVWVT